ncbi:aspartate kinase [Tenacibaculum sp. TC6]|uniref:aspartate kinase n=1 Tax=Tenacibaculum sp. TC6 TaxID=3423223 RepID=UPI003D366597
MNVLKFGGTSVSSKVSLQNMLRIIESYNVETEPLLIVVSALKGITNDLLELLEHLSKQDNDYREILTKIVNRHRDFVTFLFDEENIELIKILENLEVELEKDVNKLLEQQYVGSKDYDKIVSYGELFSAQIVTSFLQKNNFSFLFKDSRNLIVTDDNFKNARVNWEETSERIITFFSENPSNYVITGFIGSTIDGETTTLGRGGSDYTATIFGTVLGAKSVTKWTDVNGIMTADPNKVSGASSLTNITFDELKNLSKFGSNVLVHPESIGQLSKHNIPFLIRNTFNHDFVGTQVINTHLSSQKALSLHQSCSIISFEKYWNLPKKVIKEIIDKDYLFFRIKTDNKDNRTYYVVADECIRFFTLENKHLTDVDYAEMKNNVILEKRNIALITITSQSMDKKYELNRIKALLEEEGIEVLGVRLFFNSISLIFDKGNFQEVLSLLHSCLAKTSLEGDYILQNNI